MLANAAPTLLHRGSQRPLHCRMAPAQVALHRPRRPLPRRRSRRPRHCWMAPAQAALGRARPRLLRRRSSRAAPRRMAPMPALACRSRRALPRRRSRHSPCPLTADRAAPQPGQRRTQPAILSTAPTNPRHGATFPRLSGATSGYATEDAAVIAIRSPGVAAPLPICCRSTTCCRSPRAVARSRSTSSYRALLITACATTTDRLRRWSPRCSASVALLARRSTALADGSQVARRDTLRSAARRACIFAVASSDLAVVYRQRIPAASGVRTRCAVRGRRGESPERPGVPDAMLTGNNRTPMVDRQRTMPSRFAERCNGVGTHAYRVQSQGA